MRMSESKRRYSLLSLVVVWLTFALFVFSVRLIAFHDDVYNIPIIANRTILSVFDPHPYGHRDYRPIIAALWLLVRDVFGSFVPALLHFWNVAVHVLTTTLVVAWAHRLSPRSLNRWVVAVVAGLLFAFFPFAHQAVLWAGAIGHPLMTMFGLMSAGCAVVAVQRRSAWRVLAAVSLLVLGCLSHEQGFMFGAIIPALVLADQKLHGKPWTRWVWGVSVVMALAGIAYALFYVINIQSVWMSSATYTAQRAGSLADVWRSIVFNLQAMVLDVVVVLRYRLLDLFDAAQIDLLVVVLFVVVMSPALWVMWRRRHLTLAVTALLYWLLALLPAALFLHPTYIEGAPRILYPSAVGIAWFWGAVVAVLVQWVRRIWLKPLFVIAPLLFAGWGGNYIAERMAELDAYSQAVRSIAATLAIASPNDTTLLINFPTADGPTDPGPAFLRGNEGAMFHTDFNGSPLLHIAALNGRPYAGQAVQHLISYEPNSRYYYGLSGSVVDDEPLRKLILESNYVFRFEFNDGPGGRMRARQLAELQPDAITGPVFAKLQQGSASVLIRHAQAQVCGRRITVQLEWAQVRNVTQPAGIFVQGFDAAHNQIFGADADLISGYLPLEQLPPNLALTEFREIQLAADAPVPTEIQAGVYTRDGVQRWAATRGDGQPWDGDAIVVPVVADATC